MAESSCAWHVLCYILPLHGLGRILYPVYQLDPHHYNLVDNLIYSSINGRVELWKRRFVDF